MSEAKSLCALKLGGFLGLVPLLGWMGCASPGPFSATDQGEKRWCKASYPRVWGATIEAAQRLGLAVTGANEVAGVLALKQLPGANSLGENLQVTILPLSLSETSVEIRGRQVGPNTSWRGDNTTKLFDEIAASLSRG